MEKRGAILFLTLLTLLLAFSVFLQPVSAQEDSDIQIDETQEDISDDDENGFDDDLDEEDFSEITDEEVEEELGDGGAINRFDRFFDNIFQDDLENMRERFAEIRTLIRRGEIEEAKELLVYYREFADNLEREVTPEQKDEVVKLTKIIRREIRGMDAMLSDVDREEFDEISEKAKDVGIAAEIAATIEALCEQLAEVSPKEYDRVCGGIDEDTPEWRREQHRELTSEQEEEAREFFEIMSQCIETSGRECRCADISVVAFADKCAVIAPLEAICDDESIPEDEAEAACDEVDEITEDIEDLLPDYLLDVLDQVIEGFEDNEFDQHGPPEECEEAGVFDREGCEAIMFRIIAPEECIEALDRGEIEPTRRDCEEIMFDIHAPEECVEKGITDPRECGRLFEDDFGEHDRRGPGPGFGAECGSITDSNERLACFDRALSGDFDDFGPGNFEDRYRETKEREMMCARECADQSRPWFFSSGRCECGDRPDEYGYEDYYREDYREEFRDEFRDEFGDDYRDYDEFGDDYGGYYDDPDRFNEDYGTDFSGENEPDASTGEGEPDYSPPEDTSGSDSGSSDSGSSDSGSSESSGGTITGGVIFPSSGNGFLDYFFG